MAGMSVSKMKKELSEMRVSTSDCLDRADLEEKLRNARANAAGGGEGGGGASRGAAQDSGTSSAPSGGAQANPFASLAFGLQGVFDQVGTSCQVVVSFASTFNLLPSSVNPWAMRS